MALFRNVLATSTGNFNAPRRTLTAGALSLASLAFAAGVLPALNQPAPAFAQDAATNATQADDETGFVSLFDGKTLNGWASVNGPATYTVEDGTIVGRTNNPDQKANGFLRTLRDYQDFDLRLDVKFDIPFNGGIQFRSNQKPAGQGTTDGRVYGYQCELDPSARAWSGGIYGEGTRGWIQNLEGPDHEAARKALNVEGWNAIRIRCEGNHIQTWVNGVPVVDFVDTHKEAASEGFFGLQVHKHDHDGQIRWKNIRIKELPSTNPQD